MSRMKAESKEYFDHMVRILTHMPILQAFAGEPTGIKFKLSTHGNWNSPEGAYFNYEMRTHDCPKDFTWQEHQGKKIATGFIILKHFDYGEIYNYDYDREYSWSLKEEW